jgi:hypothetical protein
MVLPAGSRLRDELGLPKVVDQVPAGIEYIRLKLRGLTSTVTALTAQFGLDEHRAQGLEDIANRRDPSMGSYDMILPAEEWRTSLRQEAADWLVKWFPGSFQRLAPGELPTIEFLLTGQLQPWEPPSEPFADSGTPDWAGILDLKGDRGYWRCATIPSLRLQQRYESITRLDQRNRLVLAALEQEFTADPAGRDFMADATHGAGMLTFPKAGLFDESVGELLVRWSLTAFIRELDEQIAGIQDVADEASRKRSSRALADTQRQLFQTGIDSRIVVNDIVRYAQVPQWGDNVLDFTEVPYSSEWDLWLDSEVPPALPGSDSEVSPALQGEAPPGISLAEELRLGQITDGQRVSRLETDLREILSTSAEFGAASENLRLQRWVVWLTVIATIVAIIAAAAAVIALTRS